MKKYSVYVFLMFFYPIILSAQLDQAGMYNRIMLENWNGQYQRVGAYKVKGTVFLFGQSLNTSYKFSGDSLPLNGKFLYNMFEQKAGPELNGEIVLYDKPIERFTVEVPEKFGGNKLTFKLDTYGLSKKTSLYFNVLEEGLNYHFVKVFKTKVAMDPTNMYDKELRLFENYFEFYIYNAKSKILKKVKLNSKSILDALADTPDAERKATDLNVSFSNELRVAGFIQTLNN